MRFDRILLVRFSAIFFLGSSVLLGSASSIGQDSQDLKQDEVVEAVKAYVDAYNKRDAEAVGNLWASNGESTDANGNKIVGRKKIRKALAEKFAEMTPDDLLSVNINKVSFVTDDVAVEEGTAKIAGEQTNYTAVHRKENGKWRLHSVRETAVSAAPPRNSKLLELEWLVGEWVDESDDFIVRTSARWSKNKNFIVSDFKVERPDSDPLMGTQVIGFDASRNCIRSWTFESSGGLSQAVWKRKGEKWMIQAKYVLPDGKTGASTNVYEKKNDNEYSWKSTKRMIGNESQPDIGPVKVVKLKDESDQ